MGLLWVLVFFICCLFCKPLLGTLMPPASFVCQGIMGPEFLQICIPAKAFESCFFWMPCIRLTFLLSFLSASLSLFLFFPSLASLSLLFLSLTYSSFSLFSLSCLLPPFSSFFLLLFSSCLLSLSFSFSSLSLSDPPSNDGKLHCTVNNLAGKRNRELFTP